MASSITFVVDRRQLARSHRVGAPAVALAAGQVRFAVDTFALTANNTTYAVFGNAMKYWRFFPAADAATGCIPVWGFADVVESRCEGVAVGERFYGYWPIASEVTLEPTRCNAAGFADGAAHRRELHMVYNQYPRCSADPGYVKAREAEQALLRPLFTTSFLIDDFLFEKRSSALRRSCCRAHPARPPTARRFAWRAPGLKAGFASLGSHRQATSCSRKAWAAMTRC